MAIQLTPPPQPPQKSSKTGLGCLGCGCVLVIVIFLLLAGLVGGGGYLAYRGIYSASSPTASSVPPFNGSDDIYASAQKKVDAFNQDVNSGKTSTLTLTSDELNSLITHNPDLTRLQVQLLATLTGDQMRLQGSVPANSVPVLASVFKDRYFNFDGTFGLAVNADTKRLVTTTRSMTFGDKQVPEADLPIVDMELQPWITMTIEHYPNAKSALAAAQTVAIKDGQLVIATK